MLPIFKILISTSFIQQNSDEVNSKKNHKQKLGGGELVHPYVLSNLAL